MHVQNCCDGSGRIQSLKAVGKASFKKIHLAYADPTGACEGFYFQKEGVDYIGKEEYEYRRPLSIKKLQTKHKTN
jgi:hypothetical protein